jgi:serine/threonine-protein kinase
VSDGFAHGLVGIVLDDRYRLDAVLGEGGMGAVYRATQVSMDRKVAVKLLKPHLVNDENQLQRFAREARSTLKVDSPHAVKVLDFGVTPHRDYYMVLEYLDGRTVQRELDVDGPFAPTRVVHIARQALHALGAAHRIGIVHRDIKPDNLLLMRQGNDPDFTKVLDFGVAKLMEGAARSDQSALALTQMGMVFGTPEFMSPEQACGHALDGRSDLYSLAATMFAMLTGCALFEGKSPIEWLTHHARTPPPSLAMARPELGRYEDLDALLQRCLAKHREKRPPTAADMEAQLAAVMPSLAHAGSASAPTHYGGRVMVVSPSSYLSALPQNLVDPGATLAPPDSGESAVARGGAAAQSLRGHAVSGQSLRGISTTSGVIRQVRGRGRGIYLAIGSVALVAALGAGIGVMLSQRKAPAAARDAAVPVATDAGVTADAASIGSAPAAAIDDAAMPVAPDAGARPTGSHVPRRSGAEEHLRNAEEALRTNNQLRQIAEAQLALEADPKNVRAKFLIGDALIKSGDTDRGCSYLRKLKRYPPARDRARKANCPTD